MDQSQNNVYVGGKWTEKEFIRSIMDKLTLMGYRITHDWTSFETLDNAKLHRQTCADLDIQGVRDANIAIFLFTDPKYPYRGTFTELGAALALNKKVYVVCPDFDGASFECTTNCFFHHSSIQYVRTVEELMEKL